VGRLEAKVNTALGVKPRGGTPKTGGGRPRIGPLERSHRRLREVAAHLDDERAEIGLMSAPVALGLVGDLKRAVGGVLDRLEAIERSLLGQESCHVATLVGPTVLPSQTRPHRSGTGGSASSPACRRRLAPPPPDVGPR